MKLTSDLIYGFSGSLLSARFDEPAPTPACHKEWWDLCCSDYKRVAIAAPRGHAKSTALTKAYTLAAVLFREHDYVLVVSDTYRQATLFLGEIKLELTDNEDLKQLFGIQAILTDREDDIIVQMDDGHQFRIMAIGSEQKVRGLLWNGKRPNLILGDDLENDEIVMNPDRREKFRHWILNALLPTMSKRGKIRIVGTILHMDSFLENLMPRDHDKTTVHTPLKVYSNRELNGWMTVRYRAHDENFEHILWPVKWDKPRFKELQALFKAQGNPEGYYQEYLNRPIDPEHSFFKKDDFQNFSDQDYQREWKYAPTYLTMDLATSTKERRDWCAFGIASMDDTGMLYLRHVLRERMDTLEQVETIMRLQQRFKFSIALVGKGALEKSIGPFLKERLARNGRFLHLETIPEVIDKRMRAQSIRGRMRAGGVKFNKRAPWYLEFEQEMLQFDRGTHDDQVDMMALLGMYLDNLQDAPTAKEIDTMSWEEENEQFLQLESLSGRSAMTGY